MLARLKQEPLRDMSSAASLFGEDPHDSRAGRGNALSFATAFYGKSLMEMDLVRDGKSDAFEGKRRKGERTKFCFVGPVQNEACRLMMSALCKTQEKKNTLKQRAKQIQSGFGLKRK